MAPSEHRAERHRQVGGLFTERVLGTLDWDAPSPVPGWAARDVVRHLTEWFPPFLSAPRSGCWASSAVTPCGIPLALSSEAPATAEVGVYHDAPSPLGSAL
jgi:hypothetical protein